MARTMSTLDERRDVFWKAKAKKFAIERDVQAHRRKETEIRLADVTGDRGTILKRFRSALHWARAWKKMAKRFRLRSRFLKTEWGKSRQRYRARITELESLCDDLEAQRMDYATKNAELEVALERKETMKKIDRLPEVIKAGAAHIAALERLLVGYRFQKNASQMATLIDVVGTTRHKWHDSLKEGNNDGNSF